MSEAASHQREPGASGPGFWVRHGWKFLLGLVVVIGLFGVGDVVRGLDADAAIPEGVAGLSPDEIRETNPSLARLVDLQVRAGGRQLLVISVLWSLIILVPYRGGQRWSWYAMWTFPAWSLAVAVSYLFVELQTGVPPPPPAVSGWVFFGLTALVLMGSRRGFDFTR